MGFNLFNVFSEGGLVINITNCSGTQGVNRVCANPGRVRGTAPQLQLMTNLNIVFILAGFQNDVSVLFEPTEHDAVLEIPVHTENSDILIPYASLVAVTIFFF